MPHLLKSHGPPLVALVPIGLNFDALIGILECGRALALVEVASRPVGIESVVLRILLNCFSKMLNCCVVVLGSESLGTQFLECCHLLYLSCFC